MLACATFASSGFAAEPTGHVTWSASVRYSDNLLGAPKPGADVPPTAPRPVADVGLQFTPGAALVYSGARARWVLGYTHPMLLYFEHPLAHASGDALSFSGTFLASKLDLVDLDVGLQRATSTLTSLVEATPERDIGPVRSAAASLVRLLGSARHRHDFNERWSWFAQMRGALGLPLDDGAGLASQELAAGARATHEHHAFDAALTGLWAHVVAGTRRDTTRASSTQAILGPELGWSWDISERFSSRLTGAVAVPLTGMHERTTRPLGSATVGYDLDGQSASVGWTRSYVPNSLTGVVYFGDTVSVRGALPIASRFHLGARVGSGVAWNRAVDGVRGLDTGLVSTVVLDGGLVWGLPGLPRMVADVQWTHQVGPTPGQLLLPTFDRTVVSLGLEFAFPPLPATVPRGPRRRVDGRDRATPGDPR